MKMKRRIIGKKVDTDVSAPENNAVKIVLVVHCRDDQEAAEFHEAITSGLAAGERVGLKMYPKDDKTWASAVRIR